MKAKSLGIALVAVILVSLVAAYQFGMFNQPPKADFSYRTSVRTLNYISANDEDTIIFVSTSTDPEGDALAYSWFVDGKLVGNTKDYSTRLAAGDHRITLTSSDGRSQNSIEKTITVERSRMYQSRKLGIPIGMNLIIGSYGPDGVRPYGGWGTPPQDTELEESLSVIRYELGSDIIRLFGDYEDVMLKAAELAIRMKFRMLILNPTYRWQNLEKEEYMARIVAFAKKANQLQKTSGDTTIIFSVGNEVTLDVKGIMPGENRTERERIVGKIWDSEIHGIKREYQDALNLFLKAMVQQVRGVSSQAWKITYAAGSNWERVAWRDCGFDIVAVMSYYNTGYSEEYYLQQQGRNKEPPLPFIVIETGAPTFKEWWTKGEKWSGQPYDEEAQVIATDGNFRFVRKLGADAVLVWAFLDKTTEGSRFEPSRSYALLNFKGNFPAQRKPSFYLCKSYVLSDLSQSLAGESSTCSHLASISASSRQSARQAIQLIPTRAVRQKEPGHAGSW